MKVICDTSVWYFLSDNPNVQLKGIDLIATHNNFIELVYSPKIHNNFKKYKKACEALIKFTNPSKNIYENPILYTIHLIDPDFIDTIYNISYSHQLYTEVLRISKLLDNYNIPQDLMENAKSIIYSRKDDNIFDSDNAYLSKMKSKFKIPKNERKLYASKNYERLFREFFLKNIELYPNGNSFNYNYNIWNEIILFSKVHSLYYYKLEVDKTMKIDKNDLIDLYNLLYTNQQSLYWTTDDRWLNLIKEAKMEKYLFRPDSF